MAKKETVSGSIWIGTAIMVLAAFFYGAMTISVKLSSTYLTVWQAVIGRYALGAFLIPIIARPIRLDIFGQSRWLLILRGVAGTGAFLLIVKAYHFIPLSEGAIIFYLWPIFACLLSPWIAKETITRREWPFVIGALIGTAIMIWPGDTSTGLNIGHLFALGGSFLSGLAIILTRPLGRTNNPFTLYFYICVTGGVICLGPLLAQNAPIFPTSGIGWTGLAAVALFALFAQLLLNQGMKVLNASRTGVIMMIDPLLAAIFGRVYLGENFGIRLVFGSVLILGCSIAIVLSLSGAGISPGARPGEKA